MSAAHQLSRDEILALPPASTLADLARCLGRSEPVIRAALRNGELAALGIKVNKLGAKYLVVTASVWEALGISPADRATTVPARHRGTGQRGLAASPIRPVRQGGAA